MSVLTRSALDASPLADLHTIASELGIDGFRRLRKDELVESIIVKQGGSPSDAGSAERAGGDEEAEERPRRRSGRGSRSRRRDADPETDAEPEVEAEPAPEAESAPETRARPARRSRPAPEPSSAPEAPSEERIVDGTVELLPNGSGFVRVSPPELSDDDVYVSAAQVRRCELVSGDTVSGPVREPRRSEKYPSLVRIDAINGRPADEVAEGTHFDDLPCALPDERLALGSDDVTLKAIEWLTPIGKGSRVTITGSAHAGKSETLRRLAAALHGQEGLEVRVVLTGVRPEEASAWRGGEVEPAATLTLSATADAQIQAVERTIETAKRIAARGGDVVVLIDTLDGLPPVAGQRCLAAARNIVDGGSLTVIATAATPVGGETTIITLDSTYTRTGRFPALDLANSGTLRPELLVDDEGADAIAQARAQALGI